MAFQVFENGKPCDATGFPNVHPSWNNSKFGTFNEALSYAWKWLAPYGGSYDGQQGIGLKINEAYDFDGCGSMIEIREVE